MQVNARVIYLIHLSNVEGQGFHLVGLLLLEILFNLIQVDYPAQ